MVKSVSNHAGDVRESPPIAAYPDGHDRIAADFSFGRRLKRVDNTIGHYAEASREVTLPAGTYLVKAQAKDYLSVEVPVTIERGRTTRVHLDDTWKPASDTPKRGLVSLPNEKPVGWRAESTTQAATKTD